MDYTPFGDSIEFDTPIPLAKLANPAVAAPTAAPSDAAIQAEIAVAAEAPPPGVVELLLKDRARLDQLLRDPNEQRALIPRLLAVAIAGFTVYGIVATVILNGLASTYQLWWDWIPAAQWGGRSAGNLLLAYTIGLIAANGVCLPSFYFYSLLAGVRTTMLSVAAQALKGMAAGAVALVGILPIYMALALSAIVFPTSANLVEAWVVLGLALPFLAGIWGAACLYEGFVGFADTIPAACRTSRECFLRRLILAWCGCYTFVTPLMIYTLWNYFAGTLGGSV